MAYDDCDYSSPFEGPEKLLEIWFAPSAADVPDAPMASDCKYGLRAVPRQIWEDMLDIVKCKVLNMMEGEESDAYLLSESSFFVFPHRLILKTCGTTLNLLGLPCILDIARKQACLLSVYRCFYSRKSFMFPERQEGPHREWAEEVKFLDRIFPNGAAYTVGKMNGDHWLLYLTSPPSGFSSEMSSSPALSVAALPRTIDMGTHSNIPLAQAPVGLSTDYTIEILMSDLNPEGCAPFFAQGDDPPLSPFEQAHDLSSKIGILDIFPSHLTTLDAYSFTPCGYSANALVKWGSGSDNLPGTERLYEAGEGGEGYYTIHVTPERGWSYASFECNIPLPTDDSSHPHEIPDLKTLIQRVVRIFKPGRLTLTLFISSVNNSAPEEEEGETAVEAAQRAWKAALTNTSKGIMPGSNRNGHSKNGIGVRETGSYRRTDKINYEFCEYDLAFASFEAI